MPDTSHQHDSLDLSYVQDPEARRALRGIHQQLNETLNRQQMEIDAVIETLLEKHITSLGEFKRVVARLQQDATRMNRIHDAIAPAPAPAGAATHLPH